jgi:PAS domain S-box-containing protein
VSDREAAAAEVEALRRKLEEVERERDELRRRCDGRSAEGSLPTAQLVQILEHAPAAVYVKDAEGRFLFNNAASAAILRAAPEDIRGKTDHAFMDAEFADRMQVHDRRVLSSESATEAEEHVPGVDGTRTYISLKFPLRAGDGTPVAVCGMSTDITAQKRAEAAVRQAEARLRAMFDNAAVGIVEVNDGDRFVAVNQRICEILGYSKEELLGRTVAEVTAPEDRELSRDANARMHRREAERFSYEKRYLRRDGSRVWVHVTISTFLDEAGDYRAIGTVEDISARNAAEAEREAALEAAEDERRRLAAVLDAMPAGVAIADPTGRVTHFNAALERIWGSPPIPQSASEYREWRGWWPQTGEPLAPGDWAMARALFTGEVVVPGDVVEIEKFDGSGRATIINAAAPIRNADGAIVGGVLAEVDITAQKQAEEAVRDANERLREADRRKDEFLGMLSHELRNPLAPIRNSLHILEHADRTEDQARRAEEVASRQVMHLTRLVDDLLDVTRIARGKIELRREDIDLADLARRAADDHRALMDERRLELRVDAPRSRVPVHADETRIAQVVGNLLHNAAKFTPAGGRVTLSVSDEGDSAVIRVRDTGAGIAPAALDSMFEPFVQGEQTLARTEGGLGLGLALVKGLVALHGGAVTAASEGRGRGTEVVVALPLGRREVTASEPRGREPRRAAGTRRRVLVVDDNRDAAESLAELVELFGHEAEVAFDGPSALAKAQANPPDVVLCDIGLPGMDGYAVARALRSGDARSPRLVAVSGYAQPEDVARAREAGFDDHIAKPPPPEHIERALAS